MTQQRACPRLKRAVVLREGAPGLVGGVSERCLRHRAERLPSEAAKLWEAALTRGPELRGAASARAIASLPIMFLRSSVSRLLHGQIPCALTRSVHSVAVVGAPFSRGQVRAATRADGTLSLESFVGPGGRREKKRGEELAGSHGGHPERTWDFLRPRRR